MKNSEHTTGHKPRVLITGGMGNLGSWLAAHLAASDRYHITVLSASANTTTTPDGLPIIKVDLSDPLATRGALAQQPFEVVIHLASYNEFFEPDYARKALEINAWGTRNLLHSLDYEALQHFVYFSTFHVYGMQAGSITEASPVNPKSDYALTHYFAERYVQQYYATHQLPYTIIRLTNSYGCPRYVENSKWYLILNDLARMAYQEQRIVLKTNGQARRDFIAMQTVCQVVAEMLLHPDTLHEVFNLSAGASCTLLEIAQAVQAAYRQYTGVEIAIETNTQDRQTYPQDLWVSNEKLQRIVPYQPHNLLADEALRIFHLLHAKA